MKKSHKIILLIVVLGVICAISSFLIHSANSYTQVLKMNWGIELPKASANEIYAYSEPGFHGDGIRYHIIDYPIENESKKRQNTALKLEEIFLQSPHPSEEQIRSVNQLLEQIDVAVDVIPEWQDCNLVYLKQEDNSELFLFYQVKTGTVYIVESFL